MRQRIDEIIYEVGFAAHQLAIFSAHRINAMVVVSEHRGDFIRIKPGAINHAARFDRFFWLLAVYSGIALGERYGNRIGARLKPSDARMS